MVEKGKMTNDDLGWSYQLYSGRGVRSVSYGSADCKRGRVMLLITFMVGLMFGVGIGAVVGYVNGYDAGIWYERRRRHK